MVEKTDYGEDWEDDGNDKEDEAWMDWELSKENNAVAGMEDAPMSSDKDDSFKVMHIDEIRISVKAKIDEIKELFEMDNDSLIHIARYYSWN